jgi:hypothetical protein
MYRFSFLLIIILFMSSCNDYQKLLNSPENEVDKYTAAEEYYDNGEFRRANALFEQIIPSYRGKPQGERLVYFFANSFLKQKFTTLLLFNLRISLNHILIVKEFKKHILWKLNHISCFHRFILLIRMIHIQE